MNAMLERSQSAQAQILKCDAPTGYLHSDYARSLSDFGNPRLLQRSGGWILQRTIATTQHCDAIGCYPLFCCRDWNLLGSRLDDLIGQLVSVSTVVDPFADVPVSGLRQ